MLLFNPTLGCATLYTVVEALVKPITYSTSMLMRVATTSMKQLARSELEILSWDERNCWCYKKQKSNKIKKALKRHLVILRTQCWLRNFLKEERCVGISPFFFELVIEFV